MRSLSMCTEINFPPALPCADPRTRAAPSVPSSAQGTWVSRHTAGDGDAAGRQRRRSHRGHQAHALSACTVNFAAPCMHAPLHTLYKSAPAHPTRRLSARVLLMIHRVQIDDKIIPVHVTGRQFLANAKKGSNAKVFFAVQLAYDSNKKGTLRSCCTLHGPCLCCARAPCCSPSSHICVQLLALLTLLLPLPLRRQSSTCRLRGKGSSSASSKKRSRSNWS